MTEILAQTLPVYIVIFVGSLLRLLGLAGDFWVDILNKYGLYIGFPALIFHNLIQLPPEKIAADYPLYIYTFIILGFMIMASYTLVRFLPVDKPTANALWIGAFFGNTAYMGYPIITSLYSGISGQVSIIISIYVLYLFGLGLILLERSQAHAPSPQKIALNLLGNPFILAILAGSVVIYSGLNLPQIVLRPLAMIKDSASPVVLVSLGIFLARPIPKGIWRPTFALVALKLLALPLLFWLGAHLFLDIGYAKAAIIEAAMPVAVTPFALSSIYPIHRQIIVAAIIVSTTLSVPIILFLTLMLGEL